MSSPYDDHYDDQYLHDDDHYFGEADPAPAESRQRRLSRRAMLGAAGAGGAVLVAGAVPAAAVVRDRSDRRDRGHCGGQGPGRDADDITRFGRIFPRLPPFAEPSRELTEALTELGRPGGIMDANDPLEVGPIRLITEPELSPNNPDNPMHTAGTTFLGQFIDHDITRDGGSALGRPVRLSRSSNLRTPRLDLDTVYGGGPADSPELYTEDGLRFRVGSGGLFEDLPRHADNSAIIPDPRNDENLMISGLQVAFLLFHNAVVDRVVASSGAGDVFEEARRLVRWHWQWIVVRDFLARSVGADLVNDILVNGARHFRQDRVQIPVEFQGAAFRFGHSMVRPSYRANLAGDGGEPFFALVFDADNLEGPDPDTLLGGYRAPRRFIGWQTFFDFGDGEVKPNKRIDTKISSPLMRLPAFTIDAPRSGNLGPTSLATRNLLRHITWNQPSGQTIAQEMGAPQLAAGDLADLDQLGAGLATSTPLWFYVLREAEVMQDGLHLGPVGGRIVAEVLLELLRRDATSWLGTEPGWRPSLPSAAGAGEFEMTDLLTIAQVDPASRGQ